MMDPKIKADWLAALRSGNYKQGTGYLYGSEYLSGDKNVYCCLGVLCAVQGVDLSKSLDDGGIRLNVKSTPEEYRAGMSQHGQETLAEMNDSGEDFAAIANYIEANF